MRQVRSMPYGGNCWQRCREGTILDDVYIPMQVARQGKRVVFDDRARAWDSPDLGVDRESSRKVRTLSGNYQLVQFAPWLMSAEKSGTL